MTPRRAWALLIGTFLVIVGMGIDACRASAQVVALDAGDRAPFTGMLLPDDALVMMRREIERLRFELELHASRAAALRSADAALADTRDRIAAERLGIHDQLWRETLARSEAELARSRRREGPRWWQRGALWLPVGVIVGATTLALASR